LIVEVHGGHRTEQGAYNLERDSWLGKRGFLVLSFWNNEIVKEIESAKERIMNELERHSNTPHLNPPPQGGKKRIERECHSSNAAPYNGRHSGAGRNPVFKK